MFKKGQTVTIVVTGGGFASDEEGVVGRVTKKGVWLDNGPGNDQSGPYDPDTGMYLGPGVPGFTMHIKPRYM